MSNSATGEPPKEDEVSSIVQSFVDGELSSLDKVGSSPQSLDFSKYSAPPPSSKRAPVISAASTPRFSVKNGSSSSASSTIQGPDIRKSVPAAHHITGSPTLSIPDTARAAPSPPTGRRQPSQASVSTSDEAKRTSLGDKFKTFGRRITSSGKK